MTSPKRSLKDPALKLRPKNAAEERTFNELVKYYRAMASSWEMRTIVLLEAIRTLDPDFRWSVVLSLPTEDLKDLFEQANTQAGMEGKDLGEIIRRLLEEV